ncbi:hypothetical protein [Mesorhizobium sp. LSHC414A00]|uniref:hypothetical protein n=1 Tax=Mesorhizobium sp. LSHC414A00 TaxID=1287287 RepID=UPI0003CDDA8E|nr:hypothetical protein [Mesorhizobium sp. LSHC414A00]ESX78467.1 hypothetical protein X757_08825 [Mesorhizobium sp. LSHC414A00]
METAEMKSPTTNNLQSVGAIADLTEEQIRAQMASLQKELENREAAAAKAAVAGSAKRAVALLTAMKAAHKELEHMFPGTFEGEKWGAITPQAWPRDAAYKRAADLSETEVSAAREAGRKAIEGIK